MNRWQKIALFNLIVIVAGSVIRLVAAGTLPPEKRLMPPNRITVVIIITLVLIGLSKTIFRKSDKQQVDLDERDSQIHRKADFFGLIGFFLGTVATIWICYLAVGPFGSFPPLALPIIILVGLAFKIMVESIAALILYGWDIKGEQS